MKTTQTTSQILRLLSQMFSPQALAQSPLTAVRIRSMMNGMLNSPPMILSTTTRIAGFRYMFKT